MLSLGAWLKCDLVGYEDLVEAIKGTIREEDED